MSVSTKPSIDMDAETSGDRIERICKRVEALRLSKKIFRTDQGVLESLSVENQVLVSTWLEVLEAEVANAMFELEFMKLSVYKLKTAVVSAGSAIQNQSNILPLEQHEEMPSFARVA